MEPKLRVECDMRIRLPSHALFVGATQSGKTRLCLHLLKNPNLFNPKPTRILFHYDQYQDVYLDTKNMLKKQNIDLLLYKGCAGIDLDEIDKTPGQTILLIDDFSEETSSSKDIARIATNGRHKNVSLWLVWHSLFSSNAASRVITQNMSLIFCLPSPRLESQLRVFGAQLGMKVALIEAYKRCTANRDEEYPYLLIDLSPSIPSILRLRSNVHDNVQFCYT